MNTYIQEKRNIYVIGVLSLLVSAILTSVSQVYYANRVQVVHPFLFTGISFFITMIYFQFVVLNQRVKTVWNEAAIPLVKLNLASILAFMGFYFALKYIEPAIVSSLEMGLAPLFVLLLAVRQKIQIKRVQWWIAISTIGACFVLIAAVFSGQSAVIQWGRYSVLGIIASIICGLGAVLCTLYSKKLSELGWTSSMILAKRFYGIILLSFMATYDVLLGYFLNNIGWILIMTVLGVLVPMYLLQKGIQYCEPFIVMMSLCFVPVFTFFFQLFDTRLQWSTLTFAGVLLLLVLGIASVIAERK